MIDSKAKHNKPASRGKASMKTVKSLFDDMALTHKKEWML
jgi:hypothetical protein